MGVPMGNVASKLLSKETERRVAAVSSRKSAMRTGTDWLAALLRRRLSGEAASACARSRSADWPVRAAPVDMGVDPNGRNA